MAKRDWNHQAGPFRLERACIFVKKRGCNVSNACGIIESTTGRTSLRTGEKTMITPLTKEQKEKIDNLYRKRGWSIKKIAKQLHIGDKRISAYLRGKQEFVKPCGCESNNKPKDKNKDCFLNTVNGIVKTYEEACYNFVDTVYKTMLEEISDLLSTKKITKKEWEKRADARLSKLFDVSMDMTYSAGCAALFTMPPRFKMLWLESLKRNPADAVKKVEKSKKAKK